MVVLGVCQRHAMPTHRCITTIRIVQLVVMMPIDAVRHATLYGIARVLLELEDAVAQAQEQDFGKGKGNDKGDLGMSFQGQGALLEPAAQWSCAAPRRSDGVRQHSFDLRLGGQQGQPGRWAGPSRWAAKKGGRTEIVQATS